MGSFLTVQPPLVTEHARQTSELQEIYGLRLSPGILPLPVLICVYIVTYLYARSRATVELEEGGEGGRGRQNIHVPGNQADLAVYWWKCPLKRVCSYN